MPVSLGRSHYHYHVLALDGVVSGDVERGVRFHEATRLDVRDAEALARTVQLRVLRWFARRGLLDSTTAADMRTWRGTGGFASHLRCSVSSTAVDGSVRIEGEDRAGLELLERLARLVPPPRTHRHRYHGVLAPNARLRSTVVTIGRPVPEEFPVDPETPPSPRPASHSVTSPGHALKPAPTGTLAATPRSRSSGMLRAQLLARIYEVLPLLCPACGGEMRIISFITLPSTVQHILLHLDLPHRPPRVSPARGPPQAEFDLDQSPAFDLTAPDAIPEYEFDQSAPHDWDA